MNALGVIREALLLRESIEPQAVALVGNSPDGDVDRRQRPQPGAAAEQKQE